MRSTPAIFVGTLAVVLANAPALGAAGCAPTRCMPRTGHWQAPSPQKLTYFGQPTPLKLTVTYERSGKKVKSAYGNTVRNLGVYLRYFCPTSDSPWMETGFSTFHQPIKLDRNGSATVTISPYLSQAAHRVVLHFKRKTFSGRISGSATNSSGTVCHASVSFSGKLK